MSDLIFQLLYFGRYYLGYYSYRFNLVSHIFVYKKYQSDFKSPNLHLLPTFTHCYVGIFY